MASPDRTNRDNTNQPRGAYYDQSSRRIGSGFMSEEEWEKIQSGEIVPGTRTANGEAEEELIGPRPELFRLQRLLREQRES